MTLLKRFENPITNIVHIEPIGLRPHLAAARIGCSPYHMEELMRAGVLPYKLVGGARVIPVVSLDAYFNSLPEHKGALPGRGARLNKVSN